MQSVLEGNKSCFLHTSWLINDTA